MKIKKELALSFDDCLLTPQYFDGTSRRNINVSTSLAGLELDLPILSANMPSVTESEMAKSLGKVYGLGIIHRMCSIEEEARMVKLAKWYGLVGASIGIGKDWKDRAQAVRQAGASLICIDVAHGDQKKVIEVSEEFRKEFGSFPLLVGNIATPNLIKKFYEKNTLKENLKTTAFKIGVGGGSVCTTRVQTGCGFPTLQSVIDCALAFPEVDLVADGGIKGSGDAVKSLAAGANGVMVGSLLAGTTEAPGDVIKGRDGTKYKIYRGNASFGSKKAAGMETDYPEGAENMIPYKGSVDKILKQLKEGIQSGLSYCGVHNLKELQENSEFIRISPSGFREGLPHGLF